METTLFFCVQLTFCYVCITIIDNLQYIFNFFLIFLIFSNLQFLLMARLLSHLFIGVVFGYLYRNVGEKATTVLGNYVYLYGSILLLVYTGKMAVVLTCKYWKLKKNVNNF